MDNFEILKGANQQEIALKECNFLLIFALL